MPCAPVSRNATYVHLCIDFQRRAFKVRSEIAHVLYKSTGFYAPECERTVIWNDPDLGVEWPVAGDPIISGKDKSGIRFRDAQTFE